MLTERTATRRIALPPALFLLGIALLALFAGSARADVIPTVRSLPYVSSPTDHTSTVTDYRPGAHVDFNLDMRFDYDSATEDVGSVHVEPPEGGFGDPSVLEPGDECDLATDLGDPSWPPPHHPDSGYYSGCPASSKVGEIKIEAAPDGLPLLDTSAGITGEVFIINNGSPNGDDGELPTYLGVSMSSGIPGVSIADVTIKWVSRTRTDYGLHFSNPVSRIAGIHITRILFRFFGHLDPKGTATDLSDDVYLVTSPTRCDLWFTRIFARAYETNSNADTDLETNVGEPGNDGPKDGLPDHVMDQEPGDPGDCSPGNLKAMTPSVSTASTSADAGAVTGFSLDIVNPITQNPATGDQQPPHMKRIETILPDGMNVNPAAGEAYDELASPDRNGDGDPDFCLPTEFNRSDPDTPSTCPKGVGGANNTGTDIGDVIVTTPLLTAPLEGDIFLGDPEPGSNDRYKLLLEARGTVGVKIEGRVYVDSSGNVRSVFGDSAVHRLIPQAPVERVQLTFRGDARAPLTNPLTCGDKTTSVEITPWTSSQQGNSTASGSFNVSGNCSPAFAPSLTTELSTTQAGAHPDVTITIDRPDGNQLIKDMMLGEPSGLLGSAGAAPLCPIANADSGTCGEASHVGNITVDAGSGVDTIRTTGKLYLAEGRAAGEPASIAVKIPAVVGPFNLGNVLVNTRVQFRSSDYGLDALTTSIPTMFDGVPTRVRRMQIVLFGTAPSTGKPFMTNASGCDAKQFTAEFTSYGGGTATAISPYQATGCDTQTFAPTFAARLSETKRNSYPASTFTVTNPEYTASGKSVSVAFPEAVKPNVLGFPPVCKNEQRDADACPANTKIGDVSITTPLLPVPLQGTVHLVPGTPLPGLAVFVRGMINFRLDAKVTQGANLGIVTTFNNLPDAPLGTFVMNLQGGKNGGALKISDCPSKNGKMEAVFTSHYGKQVKVATDPKVVSCDSSMGAAKVSTKLSRGFALRLVVSQPGNAPNIRGASVAMPRGTKLKKPRIWKRLWKRYAKGTASGGACTKAYILKGATHVVPANERKLSVQKMPCRAGKLVITTRPGAIVVLRATLKKLRNGVAKCRAYRGKKKARCLKKYVSLVFKVNVSQANGKKRKVNIRASAASAIH